MCVVSSVSDKSHALFIPGEVASGTLAAGNEKFCRIVQIIYIRLTDRPGSIQALKVESRPAEIFEGRYVFCFLQRQTVVRNVICYELAEERPPGRNPRIIFSEVFVESGMVFQWTPCRTIPEQSGSVYRVGRKVGKEPAEAPFGQIRKPRTLSHPDVRISAAFIC